MRRSFVEVRGKGLVAAPPKSRAGLRRVGLPRAVVAELRKHLAEYVQAEPSSLVFTGPKGAAIRRGNARKLLRWNDALTAVGLAGVRFHDLRHTGNTLAARSGVSTRDLMTRMGHDSVRAAIIYQHATTEADARGSPVRWTRTSPVQSMAGGSTVTRTAAVSCCRSGNRGSGVARAWPTD